MDRISDLERKYVNEVLDNAFQTSKNSIFNTRMEQKFCEIMGGGFSIGHVNGTATMHTALAAAGVKPGQEVIVPPLTMSSTALAVLQNNCIPVFADVDPLTFNIDPEAIRHVITDKTRAIITVALYGLSPDYDPIKEICDEYNLVLIEDNAEIFEGFYKGKKVGTFGDFASWSFQATKHLTCGEGGMLTCQNEQLANNARRFSSLGYAGVDAKKGKITRNDIQDPTYNRHVGMGFNFRMSELQAAVVLAQLERTDELVNCRVKSAELFKQAIAGCDFLQLQHTPDDYINTYWSFSMLLKTDQPEIDWYRFRDLFQSLGGDGFYAAWKLSYHESFFQQEVQKMSGVWQHYESGLCPHAEYLQPRMIQMKTNYWDLSEAEKQAEILAETIRQF